MWWLICLACLAGGAGGARFESPASSSSPGMLLPEICYSVTPRTTCLPRGGSTTDDFCATLRLTQTPCKPPSKANIHPQHHKPLATSHVRPPPLLRSWHQVGAGPIPGCSSPLCQWCRPAAPGCRTAACTPGGRAPAGGGGGLGKGTGRRAQGVGGGGAHRSRVAAGTCWSWHGPGTTSATSWPRPPPHWRGAALVAGSRQLDKPRHNRHQGLLRLPGGASQQSALAGMAKARTAST
jgi:hypothetical protein